MTSHTKDLLFFTAAVYLFGAIGLYLRAPEHIQRFLAALSSVEQVR